MRTRDLDPSIHYATCDGNLIELVEPVHARWARVKSDGNKPYRFIELGEDSVKGKRSDPWADCHTNAADLGVRCILWKKEHINRDGYLREGHEDKGTEIVLKPEDIKGTWSDYLMLHGATVRAQADEQAEKELAKEIKNELEAWVQERLAVVNKVHINSRPYGNAPTERYHVEFDVPIRQAMAILGK